jgi:hypothetical protein
VFKRDLLITGKRIRIENQFINHQTGIIQQLQPACTEMSDL